MRKDFTKRSYGPFNESVEQGQIGDYIKPNKTLWKGKNPYKEFDDYVNYVNNTPGKIVDIIDNYGTIVYLVKYDDMPKHIDEWLDVHGSRDDLTQWNQKNTTRYTKHDNITFSKTKEF